MQFIPRTRWIRRLLLLLIAGTAIGGFCLVRATQHVPDFYAERLIVVDEGPSEVQLQDLETALSKEGPWRVAFTETEVNGWLASDMPYQFPHTVPPFASDPRIQFDDGFAQVACKYKHEDLGAILSVILHLETVDRPNSVIMKVSNPKIGAVPGPANMAMEQVRMAAARARLPVVWRDEANPTCEVILPPKVLKTKNEITIKEIVLEKGRLIVAGTTKVLEPKPPAPADTE